VIYGDVRSIEHVDDLDTAKQMLELYARENERLHKKLAELTRKLAAAQGKSESEQLQLELSALQEQLSKFQHKVFGDSTERRPRTEGTQKAEPKAQRGHGPREQVELRTETALHELPEDERACPACGAELEAIPGMTEDSDVVATVSRIVFLIHAMRQKYRCKCNGAIVTAPGPMKPIPGGRYTMEFGVQVAIDKYCDHLPLERQARILKRAGLEVTSQTLWDQLDALARHLEPTYDALREYVLDADVIGADETWWRLMKGKSSKKWWAWGLTTHDACWYGLSGSRSAATARGYLGEYEGAVVCDGYKAYETLARGAPQIRLAHCWAHARRKFVEAEEHYPKACGEALDMIGKIFAIEAEMLDPDGLDGDARTAALELRAKRRHKESRPLLEKLRAWALEQRGLPKSGLRKAIDYLLQYWEGLTAFLDDPQVGIDNNRTERALRGMVLGRKNHYGSRSERGTQVAALFYTLVESAKLCGVDPSQYLLDATERALKTPGAVTLPHELLP
jgi:transposase